MRIPPCPHPLATHAQCLYLLAEEYHTDNAIVTLIEMCNSLESCLFEDVWEFLSQNPTILEGVVKQGEGEYEKVEIVGFENRVREFISHVINCTYQVVDSTVISKMLGGLAGADLNKFCESKGWKVAEGGKVFVAPQEEVVKSKNIVESIRFDSESLPRPHSPPPVSSPFRPPRRPRYRAYMCVRSLLASPPFRSVPPSRLGTNHGRTEHAVKPRCWFTVWGGIWATK